MRDRIHAFSSFIFRGKEAYVILSFCVDLCIYPWKYLNSEASFYQASQRGKSSKISTSEVLEGGVEDKLSRGDISCLFLLCNEVHPLLDVKTKKQIHNHDSALMREASVTS